ncbi:MAG: hypothetical protein MUC60_14825 [Oscillatoria sp. Prado101]|nr:hypothetical protein [Oscillatoria sp. Prado101]
MVCQTGALGLNRGLPVGYGTGPPPTYSGASSCCRLLIALAGVQPVLGLRPAQLRG